MKKLVTLLSVIFCLGVSAQSLDEYFVMAAENNPGLASKYKDFEAALASSAKANSLPDPTVSFGYFISSPETRVGPQLAKFSLNQMFPWFGTLRAREDATALLAEAKYQEFLDAKNKLRVEIAATYFPLYELESWKKIEKENIRILESYKKIATSKVENGSASLSDALRADILLEDAKVNLKILIEKESALHSAFNNLLNQPEESPIKLPDTLTVNTLSETIERDSLLNQNPQIHALELKAQSAGAIQTSARKQGLPKIGVGIDYIVTGKRTDMDVPDNGKDAIMPMVSVSIPIFRGKYKNAIKEAALMQESLELQKQNLSNTLFAQYDMSGFETQKQADLANHYNHQIAKTQQTLNIILTAYANDNQDFQDVLTTEQQLLKYKKLKAKALSDLKIAEAKQDYITSKTIQP